MINLSYLGLISVSGPDAQRFLQGQLTCDVTLLSTVSPWVLGAHCNPQGRIISLFHLVWYRDHYWLQMPKDLIPKAIIALKKYAVFFKVTLEDQSENFTQVGFYHSPTATEHNMGLVLTMPGLTPRYQVIVEKSKIDGVLTDQDDSWRQIDIESKISHVYAETSEAFLPHELNLPAQGGVNFKKGCYTGQEIIARMEYRGKLKTTLETVDFAGSVPPKRGDDINQGRVVDYCQTNYNQYLLLIIAPITH